MSPRPRTVDDAAIAAALGRVIAKVGPSKLTLAVIAKEAGLAPATLIQRFGTKRKLLVQLSKSAGDATELVTELRAAGNSPLAIVREFLLCYAAMAPTPVAMIHSFSAYLEIDLADPVLRRYLVETSRKNEALMAGLLEEAMAAGSLARVDAVQFGRALGAIAVGSLLAWATFREGTARDWMRRDLDAILRPLERQT